MDPSSLAKTGMSAQTAGGYISGMGNILGGISSFAQYRYQAQMAKINERIAKQNAEYSFRAGEQEALRYGMQASQRMGNIRAAQGSSGVEATSGSAKEVQDSQRMVTSMDLGTIRENAWRRAYAYNVEATSYANQAKLYRQAGIQSLFAGGIDAAKSFIGSSASVADKWYQGQQVGLNQPVKDNNIITGSSGSDDLYSGSGGL